jgi:hypothetical protein
MSDGCSPGSGDCPHTASNETNMETTAGPTNLERTFGICNDMVSDSLIKGVQSA